MSLVVMDAKLAHILGSLGQNSGVFEVFEDYAMFKIKALNGQLHRIDPNNSAEIGRIQGQYNELKALTTLRKDVNDALKGTI